MPRAIPVQARAKARYDAIIQAAKSHYHDVGHDDFNLDAVAEAAGCSVATVYRYFDDRIALLNLIAPERNLAEKKLAEIQGLVEKTHLTPQEKWVIVQRILIEDV